MCFVLAKYWGTLPHVVWHYPVRYYTELRDFYLASLRPASGSDEGDNTFDFDAEMFKGDAI